MKHINNDIQNTKTRPGHRNGHNCSEQRKSPDAHRNTWMHTIYKYSIRCKVGKLAAYYILHEVGQLHGEKTKTRLLLNITPTIHTISFVIGGEVIHTNDYIQQIRGERALSGDALPPWCDISAQGAVSTNFGIAY